MRRAAGQIATLIADALSRFRVRPEQLEGQLSGAQVAPAASGAPGVIDLDDVASLPIAVTDIDATGTLDNTTFLRGDGTWSIPPGGGGGLTVEEADGTPSIADVTTIAFSGATVADDGGGQVTVTISASGGSTGWAPAVAPPSSGWTWNNQQSATVTAADNELQFSLPSDSTNNNRHYYRTAPSTPYTVTALLALPPWVTANAYACGLAFGDESGRLHTFALQGTSGNPSLLSTKWNSVSSLSANYASYSPPMSGLVWMRIADNGTNRICSLSTNGRQWMVYHTVSRTDFLTATRIGVIFRGATDRTVVAALVSWQEA